MHVAFIPKNEFNEDGLLLDSFVFGEKERERVSDHSERERGEIPTICAIVPETGTSRVKSSAIFLHNYTGN